MIFIDDRVGAVELKSHIRSPHKIRRLEYADVSFMGHGPEGPVSIGIERKRFRDLIDSISSGRLGGHQLYGLLNSYDYVYILAEGIFKVGKDGYLRRPKGKSWVVVQLGNRSLTSNYLYNYLNTLSIFTQVISVFQPSIHRSGLWIDGIYEWWQKSWDKHSALNQFHTVAPPARAFFRPPKLLVRMVKEIEGVGWDKAKEIGRRFPSILSVANADIKDLMKIKGIGKVLAGRILSDLRGGCNEA